MSCETWQEQVRKEAEKAMAQRMYEAAVARYVAMNPETGWCADYESILDQCRQAADLFYQEAHDGNKNEGTPRDTIRRKEPDYIFTGGGGRIFSQNPKPDASE